MTTAFKHTATAALDPNTLAPDLHRLLALAKTAGATDADAIATEGRSLSIGVREGELEDVDHSEGRDVGLRVFVGQRQACVSTSNLAPDTLKILAERAVAMAKIAPEDPYCGLPEKTTDTAADLDLFDPQELDADTLLARAKRIDAAALSVPGILQVEGASASATSSAIFYASSRGFAKGWRSSRHNLSVTALAEKGGAMERDYDYDGARWLSDMRSPEEIGKLASERTLARLDSRGMPSTTMPVIFERRVAGSLLSALISAISGPSIARGTSFLKDKMGEQIFASGISITDDPLIQRGHGSRPWDGEGVAVAKRALIKDGRLQSWLLNSSTARQLGLETTGHAHRSAGAPPGVASTNVVLQPGPQSPTDMMATLSHGLLVTEMFGPSLNSNTGDYSVGVSGMMIENGEIAYPVSEITIAGNLLDMFATLAPANDLIFDSATTSPTVLIESMAIAGQ